MELNTLIQRAKEKDPSAFDTIYRTYYPKMMGLCMNITRDDRTTAVDLVHDAFILAFASIGSHPKITNHQNHFLGQKKKESVIATPSFLNKIDYKKHLVHKKSYDFFVSLLT